VPELLAREKPVRAHPFPFLQHPERVRRLSLLVVDKGAAFESLRGHVAARISYGSELSDNDWVVNFLANMPEDVSFAEKAAKGTGVLGHFPSRAFLVRYKDFAAEYGPKNRGVKTLEIKVDDRVRERTLEFYNAELKRGEGSRPWQTLNYNCAVMFTEALSHGLGRKLHAPGMNMPDRLEMLLGREGLIGEVHYDPPKKTP
jgi:hypothetical protein